MSRGDFAAAVVELKRALQANPQSDQARLLLGLSLLESGDPAGGLVELEKASESGIEDSDTAPAIARALLLTGRVSQVIDRFSGVQLKDPKANAELRASLATAYLQQGLKERARAAIETALRSDPKNTTAQLLGARFLATDGNVDGALAQVDKLLTEHPQLVDGWLLKGELLWLGKRDPAAAATAFEASLAVQTTYLPARVALARMHFQSGDMKAFRAQVDGLQRALPGHPETLFAQTQLALLVNQDLPRARELMGQLLRLEPDSARVLHLAGLVEHRGGAMAAAETHLTKAIQLAPDMAVTRQLLAEIYLGSGQHARALSTLQVLLNQASPSAVTLSLAGQAHLQAGRFAQAEDAFQRATKAAPGDVRLQANVAAAKIAGGRVAQGLAELESLAVADTGTQADLALISANLQRGDLRAALKAIERLEKKLPSSPTPHALRGRVQFQQREIALARASFDRALAAEPKYYPAVAGLAEIDVIENKVPDAIRRLEQYREQAPRNHLALSSLVALKQRSGADPASIKTMLEAAVRVYPADMPPRLLLVDWWISQGDLAAARTAAQQAVAALPGDMDLQDAFGRAHMASGDTQQALGAFSRVAASRPASLPAQLRLAEAQLVAKDFAAAQTTLKRALELDPRSAQAQAGLVAVALGLGRPDDALPMARALQQQQPKQALGFLLEAEALLARRQFDRAVKALGAAFAREATTANAMRLHGALVLAGQPAQADRMAASWLKDHPRDAAFRAQMGTFALGRGDFVQAESDYRTVVELVPGDAVALNNLAWALVQQRKPEALQFAKKANELSPNQPALMDTLSAALELNGRQQEAVANQRKAVAGAGANPNHRLRLAQLLVATGDRPGARAELETLQKLGNSFPRQDEVTSLLRAP